MLRVIDLLGTRQPIRLLRTFLWPHAMPPGSTDREGFLSRGQKVLREVARAGLARFADAFVEEGAFAQDEVRPFLEEARALGLGLKLHVDQLRTGQGAEFAASLHARVGGSPRVGGSAGIAALARGPGHRGAHPHRHARPPAAALRAGTRPDRRRRRRGRRHQLQPRQRAHREPRAGAVAGLPPERAHPDRGPAGGDPARGRGARRHLAGQAAGGRPGEIWWFSVRRTSTTSSPTSAISHVQAVVRAGRIVLRSGQHTPGAEESSTPGLPMRPGAGTGLSRSASDHRRAEHPCDRANARRGVHIPNTAQLQWVGPAPLRTSRRSDMSVEVHVSSVRFPVGCVRAGA